MLKTAKSTGNLRLFHHSGRFFPFTTEKKKQNQNLFHNTKDFFFNFSVLTKKFPNTVFIELNVSIR